MNNAHTPAAHKAGPGSRAVAFALAFAASFSFRTAALGAAAVALLQPVAASAADRDPPPRYQQAARDRAQQREDVRQFDPRAFEARVEEQRRQMQQAQHDNPQNAEPGRRPGRLTPDERRDLRRQINEAGMDIYPNTPRR
ncbi:MAG: hypothetical protein ACLGI6_11890 [Gammaproteobacteria bacterium]